MLTVTRLCLLLVILGLLSHAKACDDCSDYDSEENGNNYDTHIHDNNIGGSVQINYPGSSSNGIYGGRYRRDIQDNGYLLQQQTNDGSGGRYNQVIYRRLNPQSLELQGPVDMEIHGQYVD